MHQEIVEHFRKNDKALFSVIEKLEPFEELEPAKPAIFCFCDKMVK